MMIRLRLLTLMLLAIGCSADALADGGTTDIEALYADANSYFLAEEYPDALELYVRCLDMAEKAHDYTKICACLGNLGLIFGNINDYERSIHYTRRAFDVGRRHHDLELQRKSAEILVELYCLMGQTDSARYYNKVQKNIPTQGYHEGNYLSLYNDGLLAKADGRYTLAIYYFNRTLDYARSHGLPRKYELQQLMEVGSTMVLAGQPDEALVQFDTSEQIARELASDNMLLEVYEEKVKLFQMLGDTAAQARYQHLRLMLADSITDRNRLNAARNQLFLYESQQTDEHISMLNHRIGVQTVAIVVILMLLGLLTFSGVFVLLKNHKLREAQRLLIAKNDELQQQADKSMALREQLLEATDGRPDCRYDAGLSPHQVNVMVKRINTVFDDMETISNPDFNLTMLVSMVESNSTYVSWVINEAYGKSFKTLLNEHRIKEACRRLSDEKNFGRMTIQAICESVGYSSASNFIKAFKTIVGMTPSVYQRLQRQQHSVD